MESGDGGWICAEPAQPDGDGDEDSWPATVAGPAAGKRWGHGGIPGFSAWVATAVAMVAAAAGVAVGLFLIRGTPPASVVAGSAPSAPTPASASASIPASARPGRLQVALTGRVLAVSRTSITIGGEGASVTAAVTGATTITGRAHGIGGVETGDEVSAQLTGTATRLTATAIRDLARA
jgi:hypothetical protein